MARISVATLAPYSAALLGLLVAALLIADWRRITSLEEHAAEMASDGTRLLPVSRAVSNIVVVGIRWTENGKTKYLWRGTGFAISGTPVFATAAHVIEWATQEVQSLRHRDLAADLVARFPDSAVATITHPTLHPRFEETHTSDQEPSVDVAVFYVDSHGPLIGLPLARRDVPEVGQECLVAGFPTENPQIRYPSTDGGTFEPTVRLGRIERLIDVDDLATSNKKNLIQCNLPLIGGFSGAPVLDLNGQVIGVATFSSQRLVRTPDNGSIRLVDPAQVGFAISKVFIEELLRELDVRP